MNGRKASIDQLIAGLRQGVSEFDGVDVAVCPSYVYIPQAVVALSGTAVAVGAQDVALAEHDGAFTGDVSAAMLHDVGCLYVIVGHSERRAIHGETDAQVAEKIALVMRSKLFPILCVGETLEEREQGVTEAVVARQLDAVLERVGVHVFEHALIAYEPVWAIGTGRTASPQQAQDVHAFIRARLAAHDVATASRARILYGGSMKPENALELMGMQDIDGGLIGGASLKAEDFLSICHAARDNA